jgi:hypothetical protein
LEHIPSVSKIIIFSHLIKICPSNILFIFILVLETCSLRKKNVFFFMEGVITCNVDGRGLCKHHIAGCYLSYGCHNDRLDQDMFPYPNLCKNSRVYIL